MITRYTDPDLSRHDTSQTDVGARVLVPPVDGDAPANPVLGALLRWGDAVRAATSRALHALIDTRPATRQDPRLPAWADDETRGIVAEVRLACQVADAAGVVVLQLVFERGAGLPAVGRTRLDPALDAVLLESGDDLEAFLARVGWLPALSDLLRDMSAGARAAALHRDVLAPEPGSHEVEIHVTDDADGRLVGAHDEIWDPKRRRGRRVFQTRVASIPRAGEYVHVAVGDGIDVRGVVMAVHHDIGAQHDVSLLVERRHLDG